MWINTLNPTLLKLGTLEIRWYGLVYVLGFFLTIAWMYHLRKKQRLKLTKDEIWDFTFYLMLGVLIGSRLFEIFWDPHYYLSNPLNLLKFWQGGMSFHGGLVGIVVAAYLYCRKKKINFWQMADILAIPAMLTLALGRIANFINGELWGRVANSFCIGFPNAPDHGMLCRYPSTLYAAAKRFLILFWLLFLHYKNQFKAGLVTSVRDLPFKAGFIFWNFVFWEGLGRFIVDFYREDILYHHLSLGQWFSLIMIGVALIIFIKNYRQDWNKLFKE